MAQHIEGTLITPDEDLPTVLATLFCEMDSDKQAAFFNQVSVLSADWMVHPTFQWRRMQEDLTPQGRQVIVDMKEHTE